MVHDRSVLVTHLKYSSVYMLHHYSALSVSLGLMKAVFALERHELIMALSPLSSLFLR